MPELSTIPAGQAEPNLPPLNLPLDHPGLNLLKRLRDEAHRFANTYNADLRSRKIKESVLDDFPGLVKQLAASTLQLLDALTTGLAKVDDDRDSHS